MVASALAARTAMAVYSLPTFFFNPDRLMSYMLPEPWGLLDGGVPQGRLREGAVGGQVRHAAATEGGLHVEHVDGVDVLGYTPQRGVRGN